MMARISSFRKKSLETARTAWDNLVITLIISNDDVCVNVVLIILRLQAMTVSLSTTTGLSYQSKMSENS